MEKDEIREGVVRGGVPDFSGADEFRARLVFMYDRGCVRRLGLDGSGREEHYGQQIEPDILGGK